MAQRNSTISNIILPVSFPALVVVLGLLLLRLNTGSWWPSTASLIYWDAGWYHSIATNGYQFDPNQVSNTAFFPLFPYVWRLLGVGEAGISAVNFFFFITGCFLLFRYFDAKLKIKLIYLSLSLAVFYTTPMSESLFFLFSVLILIGLHKDNQLMTLSGVIGACLCRSVSTVFVPSFLLLFVFRSIKDGKRKKNLYIVYTLTSLIVLFFVFFIQYLQTGDFWAFSHSQKFWSAHFQLPDIPFSTWQPEENGYVDQLAVFISFLSMIYVVYLFVSKLKNTAASISDAAMFSVLYLAGTATLMLFTHGGGFNSMNRYILSTPFLFMFMREVAQFDFKKSVVIGIMLFGLVYYIVGWHMATSIHRIIVFLSALVIVFLLGYCIKKDTRYTGVLLILFIVSALIVQAILWSRFVTNTWVG
jgi:hypothetical protein